MVDWGWGGLDDEDSGRAGAAPRSVKHSNRFKSKRMLNQIEYIARSPAVASPRAVVALRFLEFPATDLAFQAELVPFLPSPTVVICALGSMLQCG